MGFRAVRCPLGGAWCASLLVAWAPLAAQQTRANTIDIVAVNDSTYQVSGRATTGLVYLRFTNRSRIVQSANLVAVAPDMPMDTALGRLRAGQFGRFIANAGGIGATGPGQSVTVAAVLPPGPFIVMSRLQASDGRPWFAHGMVAPLVIGGTGDPREPGRIRVSARVMTDARFQYWRALYARNGREELLSGVTFNEALWAGRHILRFENPGGEHEVVIIRAPTVAPQVMSQYVGNRRLAPGAVVVGGLGPMQPQSQVWMHLDMEPGVYFIFCPLFHQRSGLHGFRSGEQAMVIVRRQLN